MVRVSLGRALEELPGLESVRTLHHPHAELVQDGRVAGRELRRADEELLGLGAASRGARGLCRLDHPEDGGVLRGCRFNVAQRFLASRFARRDSSAADFKGAGVAVSALALTLPAS